MPPPSLPRRVDLSDNALLAVSGDDARLFLHAQLTNDVEALKPGEAQWSGWCTAKGRLLATFLLSQREREYLALLPAAIAPAIAKRLSMFVLRSKVKIRDASSEFDRVAIVGPGAAGAAEALRAHAGILVKEVAPEAVVVIAAAGDARMAAWRATHEAAPREAWDLALIHAGIPTVVAATQEAFVPQMANFEVVGGVSFRKGCYPGQEIVARTQYRGILKRRMALAHVDSPASPSPGDAVFSPAFGDQAAGTVANVAPAPGGGFDLLVVAQLEALGGAGLRLADGTELRLMPLPYALPSAA